MIIYPYYLKESEYKYWQPYTDVYFEYFFGQYKHEKEIVFFHPDEYQSIIEDKEFFEKVLTFAEQNNIDLKIWLGYHTDWSHPNVVNWKWYLVHLSNYLCNQGLKKLPEIRKLYTCYNRRARLHRCKFIDKLYKNKLQDLGYISWHNIYEDSKKSWQYNFEHFTPKKIVYDNLDTGSIENRFGYIIKHKSFFDSVFNIVTESDYKCFEISEKTYSCIWHKRPFIILGSKKIHKYLESIGIQKYPIFDYSFDDEDNLDTRINGIIKNLNNLKDKDWQELYNQCKSVCEQNYTTLMNLCKNDSMKKEFLKINDNSINYQNYKRVLL